MDLRDGVPDSGHPSPPGHKQCGICGYDKADPGVLAVRSYQYHTAVSGYGRTSRVPCKRNKGYHTEEKAGRETFPQPLVLQGT